MVTGSDRATYRWLASRFIDWGAIAESVGAVAIPVTLVYLATQVRHVRHMVTDANRTSRVEGIREPNGLLTASAEVRAAWNRGMGQGIGGFTLT